MLYEDREKLPKDALNMMRAIDSLKEELEAIDLYNQRAAVCPDEELKKILIHNMNEEKEHAAILLGWIQKHDPTFKKELKEYVAEGKELTQH
ncbi:MAG: ferritin [Candidatus Woesearchaeota archaeon]